MPCNPKPLIRESVIQLQTKSCVQLDSFDNYIMPQIVMKNEDVTNEGKYDQDENLIFQYLHKKFNSKKRDWTGKAKIEEILQIDKDIQEETVKGTNMLQK